MQTIIAKTLPDLIKIGGGARFLSVKRLAGKKYWIGVLA
jgi:hypothetical protein